MISRFIIYTEGGGLPTAIEERKADYVISVNPDTEVATLHKNRIGAIGNKFVDVGVAMTTLMRLGKHRECPQCAGTGLYISESSARYGDEPQECSMCRGTKVVPSLVPSDTPEEGGADIFRYKSDDDEFGDTGVAASMLSDD